MQKTLYQILNNSVFRTKYIIIFVKYRYYYKLLKKESNFVLVTFKIMLSNRFIIQITSDVLQFHLLFQVMT